MENEEPRLVMEKRTKIEDGVYIIEQQFSNGTFFININITSEEKRKKMEEKLRSLENTLVAE